MQWKTIQFSIPHFNINLSLQLFQQRMCVLCYDLAQTHLSFYWSVRNSVQCIPADRMALLLPYLKPEHRLVSLFIKNHLGAQFSTEECIDLLDSSTENRGLGAFKFSKIASLTARLCGWYMHLLVMQECYFAFPLNINCTGYLSQELQEKHWVTHVNLEIDCLPERRRVCRIGYL